MNCDVENLLSLPINQVGFALIFILITVRPFNKLSIRNIPFKFQFYDATNLSNDETVPNNRLKCLFPEYSMSHKFHPDTNWCKNTFLT